MDCTASHVCFHFSYIIHATTHSPLLPKQHWTLQWRHNEHDGVSNHQPHDCLLNRLFWRRSKKTTKLLVTDLCAGNSPVTGEFPTQRASNEDNLSILMTSSWALQISLYVLICPFNCRKSEHAPRKHIVSTCNIHTRWTYWAYEVIPRLLCYVNAVTTQSSGRILAYLG